MPQPMEKELWYEEGLRFTCTQCGNCCTGPPGYVWFNDEELQRMADRLNLTIGQFRKKYCKKIFGRWSLDETETQHGHDCVLLVRDEHGRGRCSIYEDRPTQCKTWPFWPDNLRSPRSWAVASGKCPGMQHGSEGKGTLYTLEQIRIQRDITPK